MLQPLVCTVVTKSHLSGARVLAQTLAEHQPGVRLLVLLADRVDGHFGPALEPFTMIGLDDLADPAAAHRMAFYYTPFELCCALRGMLHRYVIDHTDAPAWLFLDADIMVCGPLDAAFAELDRHPLLLSPHRTAPCPGGDFSLELSLLRGGTYNGGFLGCRRGPVANAFAQWFSDRLEHFALDDVQGTTCFVDQKWLNLVPVYFSEAGLFRHPGANLGHWSLDQRELARQPDGTVTVDGQPLLFVHFSGWDVDRPDDVSAWAPHRGAVPDIWKELAARYRERLLANGHTATRRWPYAFATFDDGTPITREMRRLYRQDVMSGTAADSSPFACGGEFRAAVRSPSLLRRAARRTRDMLYAILRPPGAAPAAAPATRPVKRG